jgi:hypothetical protein
MHGARKTFEECAHFGYVAVVTQQRARLVRQQNHKCKDLRPSRAKLVHERPELRMPRGRSPTA